MKKKSLKLLNVNKEKISNLNKISGGIASYYSPCEYTPTYLCDYKTNFHGMCRYNGTYASGCGSPC
ncbi:hypothetical protein [Kordia zhangzhouensis]|uniref:hypothetical protein n=1 Tax=Kordia zhangzhouensis TaxID=1620405 RepID=UPI0012FCFF38|nr:hypothetical protein [Kordia zhangzhouensis]